MSKLLEIENLFNVKAISKKYDVDIILENYWTKFSSLFPIVKKDTFISWINEDTIGGWEESLDYNTGGRRELILLYCTIRASKPKKLLEIGTHKGFSTKHILLALQNNYNENHICKIDTIDIVNYDESNNLGNYPYNKITANSLDYIKHNFDYDFVVQDGCHNFEHVDAELKLLENFKSLKVFWAHDYHLNNNEVGKAIDSSNFLKSLDIFYDFKEVNYNAGFFIGKK